MTRYNTNLAAEFYVLSMLHRLGAEASLTLGNKKSVDIFIASANSEYKTLDVKGLADSYDWPADNIHIPAPPNHYVGLLSFEGKIHDPHHAPSIWILPANDLSQFVKRYKTRAVVSRALIKGLGAKYLHAWAQLLPTPGG
jgi:hypothetical protein